MAGVIPFGVATVSGAVYTVNPTPAVASVVAGVSILVQMPSANTGPAQLAVVTTGGTVTNNITMSYGATLAAYTYTVNQTIFFTFDGTNWEITPGFISGLISVEQYGVVGNGTTDDSTHLHTADAAGNVVLTSNKTYYINSSLDLKNDFLARI